MSVPHDALHEVWWIYSPVNGKEWAGLRIAHFHGMNNGGLFVVITGETDPRRIGLRDWTHIQRTELWYRVKQIPIPTLIEIMGAAIPLDVEDRS